MIWDEVVTDSQWEIVFSEDDGIPSTFSCPICNDDIEFVEEVKIIPGIYRCKDDGIFTIIMDYRQVTAILIEDINSLNIGCCNSGCARCVDRY